MSPSESVAQLTAFFTENDSTLALSTPREGVNRMFSFYETVSFDGCNDDRLLFQWGTNDWGSGRFFELNITRQFIEADLEDDDAISQLSLTYKFAPAADLECLGSGNCWSDGPKPFREFVFGSQPFTVVADKEPCAVDLTHSYV